MNYIIGGIYRHPGGSIKYFTDDLDKTLQTINKAKAKTTFLITGDINVDFLRYAVHEETKKYTDMILSNNFIPLTFLPILD